MNRSLYIYLARRWTLFAVIPALIVGALTYGIVREEPRTYQTQVSLYVQQPSESSLVPGTTDVQASNQVIPTYSQMITSPIIESTTDSAVASKYPGYKIEKHDVKVSGAPGTASISLQPNSALMTLTVTDTNRQRAAYAANMLARVFIDRISLIQKARFTGSAKAIQQQLDLARANIQDVTQQLAKVGKDASARANLQAELQAYQSMYQSLLSSSQEFTVNRDTAINAVKVFSPAPVPTTPVGPHPARLAAVAVFLALLLGIGGIMVYDYLDDSLKTPEEIEEIVNAPILGTVQQFDPGKGGSTLVVVKNTRSTVAEAYRVIRTNLQFTSLGRMPRSIVITSSSPSEGKSTTAANLAAAFAQSGKAVSLIDADLRRPSMHRYFGIERREGFTNLLVSEDELNGHNGQPANEVDNLTLLAAGPLPPRPADLLNSARVPALLNHFSNKFDLTILDTPPVLAVADAAILSTIVDGVVLVVDPGKTKRRDLMRSRESIEGVGGRILGVVINRLERQNSPYYYYYYQHHYGYEYKYDYTAGRGANAVKKDETAAGAR